MMKQYKHISKYLYILSFLPLCMFCSCSSLDSKERFQYVEPAEVSMNVLIEDFTGQLCVNCPKATEMIAQLQDQYGEDVVIPVAIHCGPFKFKGNAKNVGLATDLGDEYWDHWFSSTQGQPVAKFNRTITTEDYANWGGELITALSAKTNVDLNIECEYDEATRNVAIFTSTSGTAGEKAKLQLWLVEDGIVASQKLPDGSVDKSYVHNHVLRDAINGAWGEEFTFPESFVTFQKNYTVPENCNAENCSIIAFVYSDDGGVQQVYKRKLINE